MSKTPGTLYVVSAASGAGKTSLVRWLAANADDLMLSISHTTRPRRDREADGEHYHFVADEEFSSMLEKGDFLESATVFGNRYGTSERWVRGRLSDGVSVVLEIDWQGARQVREVIPCVGIFVLPPSLETLRGRLKGRGQDSDSVIDDRMRAAVDEMSHYAEFDYLLVNDDFDTACTELRAIVTSVRLRAEQQMVRHEELISSLLGSAS